jgi:predicted dithiol-disulfide oxidoreductase (DUF899 family)
MDNPVEKELEELSGQIRELQKKEIALKQKWGACDVLDYELQSVDGPVKLSEAFGDKSLMVLVHNMGKQCPYCTLWADGFSSIAHHVEEGVPGGETRAAFIVVSPDDPQTQKEYAESRGWKFRMLSAKDSSLTMDLGYQEPEKGYYLPGMSILKKEGDKITRVARDFFGPGDNYNFIFRMFELMPGSPMS